MSAKSEAKGQRRSSAEFEKSDWKDHLNFSLPTHLNHLSNDLSLQEKMTLVHNYRKEDTAELKAEIKRMFDNLLQPTVLEKDDSQVHFAKNYQIKLSSKNLYLSALIPDKEIDETQNFREGCYVTASQFKDPCNRNTFKFVGTDLNRKTVYYGEDVYIQLMYNEHVSFPLYVQCENRNSDHLGGHMKLCMTDDPGNYCRFKVLHSNSKLRGSTVGTPIKPNIPLVIQHCASGRDLAAEFEVPIPTFFGVEFLVSCHTFKDAKMQEMSENFWIIENATGKLNETE